ncbi:hypothetical protein Zm00014a_029804 [Zea mays]|uniref:Transmembrane protein 50A n=1 Tax=Zea mays TaxID=4577 RepID=A0A3L6EU93_MAIZE|nr:hypothetical protein Zm00014a_029804 [Zea mays]
MDSNNLLAAWPVLGPGVAGAVFGAGWWFWVDAVVCSAAAVPFLHYLPGFFASFAALMFNCVNREDIGDGYYSPYDDSEWRHQPKMPYSAMYLRLLTFVQNKPKLEEVKITPEIIQLIYVPSVFIRKKRVKLWLFISYVVSFVSLAGAVGFLVQDALTDTGPSAWTGSAGILQCVFVLVSGLIYWTCHSED